MAAEAILLIEDHRASPSAAYNVFLVAYVFVLISQGVKDGANRTLITATLRGHTSENALQTLEIFHLGSDLSNVVHGDSLDPASHVLTAGKTEEIANVFDGEAQLAGTPDEHQTCSVLVAIEPMPTRAAGRLRH